SAQEAQGVAMLLKVSSGGVPAGNYQGEFLGVESFQDQAKKYAEGLRWKWKIIASPQAGQIASRITSAHPSPKNACGKIISGLLGRALKPEEEIDIDSLIGKAFLLIVAQADTGTRVETVMPMPAAA